MLAETLEPGPFTISDDSVGVVTFDAYCTADLDR